MFRVVFLHAEGSTSYLVFSSVEYSVFVLGSVYTHKEVISTVIVLNM